MNLMRGTPLQYQLNDLLNNLEATYLDLVGGKLWSGVTATPQQSSYLAGNIDDEKKIKDAQEMAAKINLPWDKWGNYMPSVTIVENNDTSVLNALITSRKSSWARSSTQMEAIARPLTACLLHDLPIMHPLYVATIS
jgi:hypothetical protein